MAAEHAAAAGLRLLLGGREKDRQALEVLASRIGGEVRIFRLDNPAEIRAGLTDVTVILNAAGPFMKTAEPLMSAAIASGVHYLDFSAELDTYREALALDVRARAAGVMLLPGSGGSVAMLGCLAAHAVRRIDDPLKISIALEVAGAMSRGSATSASQNIAPDTLQLVNGELVSRSPDDVRDFNWERPTVIIPGHAA